MAITVEDVARSQRVLDEAIAELRRAKAAVKDAERQFMEANTKHAEIRARFSIQESQKEPA